MLPPIPAPHAPERPTPEPVGPAVFVRQVRIEGDIQTALRTETKKRKGMDVTDAEKSRLDNLPEASKKRVNNAKAFRALD